MDYIKLTNGNKSLIDKEDLPLCKGYKFYLANGYAYSTDRPPILLHRLVMGFPDGVIHHINGNKLDNRKLNLEVKSISSHVKGHNIGRFFKRTLKNRYTLSSRKVKSIFGFKGVTLAKNTSSKVFKTQISYKNHRTSLGYFEDPLTANMVYQLVVDEIYNTNVTEM